MADTITTDLGPVTAYADAVAHGYTGTREDFGKLLAGAGQNLQDAVTAKEAAETARTGAENAAQQAGTAAESAAQSAGTANSAAGAASTSAEAAASAKTAAETAQGAAATSQEAAAKSAEAAKKSADDAKTVQDSLPADYAQLSSDVDALNTKMQLAYPDNTSVGDATWGAKQIIDTLCPPIDETGNPVQCYPVAGYPLGCKVSWEPVQEGSGDPSPDNVRAIKGRESVTVERCGENLLDSTLLLDASHFDKSAQINGFWEYKVTLPPGSYTVFVPKTANINGYLRISKKSQKNGVGDNVWFCHPTTSVVSKSNKAVFTVNDGLIIGVSPSIEDVKKAFENTGGLMITHGTSSPSVYLPYTGQTNTLTLPETVYGGEVDAVTGKGQETWKSLTFDGTEDWSYDPRGIFITSLTSISKQMVAVSDRYTGILGANENALYCEDVVFVIGKAICGYTSISDWKSYLAAQYAAGTPVQIAYKLATPKSFTATGTQPILALSGVNTILTDANTATVTGRADPIKRITDLEDAVASMTT